jgi:hypothetical protein
LKLATTLIYLLTKRNKAPIPEIQRKERLRKLKETGLASLPVLADVGI